MDCTRLPHSISYHQSDLSLILPLRPLLHKIMAELSGKFQLSDADEDNFDKIMAAVGIKIRLIVIYKFSLIVAGMNYNRCAGRETRTRTSYATDDSIFPQWRRLHDDLHHWRRQGTCAHFSTRRRAGGDNYGRT